MSGEHPPASPVDVEKTLRAFRTRIADLEARLHAERTVLPGRLASAAFAVGLFALTAVPWVTVGSERPKSYTLWGFVERVEGVSALTLIVVLALAGMTLWAGCVADAGQRVSLVVGALALGSLVLLVWMGQQAGDEFDERSVDWWPAPWLLAFCVIGAAGAVAARRR